MNLDTAAGCCLNTQIGTISSAGRIEDIHRIDSTREFKDGKTLVIEEHEESERANPRSDKECSNETRIAPAQTVALSRYDKSTSQSDQQRNNTRNLEDQKDRRIHEQSIVACSYPAFPCFPARIRRISSIRCASSFSRPSCVGW